MIPSFWIPIIGTDVDDALALTLAVCSHRN